MIQHILILSAAVMEAGVPAQAAAEAPQEECSKPVLIDSPTVTATVMNSQMQQAQTYVDCMAKAIEVQRALAADKLDLARAEAEKSNAMIVEFNDFIAKVKAYQEEHSGG